MKNTPSSSPSVLDRLTALTDAERRAQVTTLAAVDLKSLLHDIRETKQMPALFELPEMQRALEKRMEELGITLDARDQWESLKKTIGTKTEALEDNAEKSFASELMRRAGSWGVVGSGLLAVLSWLGFSKAKDLRTSIATRGYLRTAIEGAKEHPIFAALIAGLGLKAGSEGYQYIQQNMPAIEDYVESIAGRTGRGTLETVKDFAEKAKDAAVDLKDSGLRGLVKGIVYAMPGATYDEETGVVTMPNFLTGGNKTLKPPFITAWKASVRREGGHAVVKKAYSLFLIEDRFDAILRQADTTDALGRTADASLLLAAKRGKELLARGHRPGGTSKESRELDQVLRVAIDADPELQRSKPLDVTAATPRELQERLAHVEAEMSSFYAKKEVPSFKETSDAIRDIAHEAQEKLRTGKHGGDSENVKKEALRRIKERIDAHSAEVNGRKVALGKEYADLLSANRDEFLEHAKHKLDTGDGGAHWTERGLEKTTKGIESIGYKVSRMGGKYVMGAITGYSFLPLALEGAAALRSGEEGDAAKKAFALDAGEALGGFIPGVGEALDFRAAVMGTDLNGRELDTWQRVTSGAMGVLGTASIVAGFFTGGTSIVAWRAIRGVSASVDAARTIDRTLKGVEVANATAKTVKNLNKSKDGAKALENMLEITTLQKKARRVQSAIHNVQRGMQIVTYGQLGFQLASGVTTIYGNAEAFVQNAQDRIASGAESVQHALGELSAG
jgi:hypothetical protein